MKVEIGDFVKTTIYNYTGRVVKTYSNWDELAVPEEWFNLQEPAMGFEKKLEPWYDVLLHLGGWILIPESYVKEVSKIPFQGYFYNYAAGRFFKDMIYGQMCLN